MEPTVIDEWAQRFAAAAQPTAHAPGVLIVNDPEFDAWRARLLPDYKNMVDDLESLCLTSAQKAFSSPHTYATAERCAAFEPLVPEEELLNIAPGGPAADRAAKESNHAFHALWRTVLGTSRLHDFAPFWLNLHRWAFFFSENMTKRWCTPTEYMLAPLRFVMIAHDKPSIVYGGAEVTAMLALVGASSLPLSSRVQFSAALKEAVHNNKDNQTAFLAQGGVARIADILRASEGPDLEATSDLETNLCTVLARVAYGNEAAAQEIVKCDELIASLKARFLLENAVQLANAAGLAMANCAFSYQQGNPQLNVVETLKQLYARSEKHGEASVPLSAFTLIGNLGYKHCNEDVDRVANEIRSLFTEWILKVAVDRSEFWRQHNALRAACTLVPLNPRDAQQILSRWAGALEASRPQSTKEFESAERNQSIDTLLNRFKSPVRITTIALSSLTTGSSDTNFQRTISAGPATQSNYEQTSTTSPVGLLEAVATSTDDPEPEQSSTQSPELAHRASPAPSSSSSNTDHTESADNSFASTGSERFTSSPWELVARIVRLMGPLSDLVDEIFPAFTNDPAQTDELGWSIMMYVNPEHHNAGFPSHILVPTALDRGWRSVQLLRRPATQPMFAPSPALRHLTMDELEPVMSIVDASTANAFIQRHAPNLFRDNSNLMAMTASAVRHRGMDVLCGSTIVCYVREKGVFPYKSQPLANQLRRLGAPFPVDVREGLFSFSSAFKPSVQPSDGRLHMGCSIGIGPNVQDQPYTDDEAALPSNKRPRPSFTLGAFARRRGRNELGVLTCGHGMRYFSDDDEKLLIHPGAIDANACGLEATTTIAIARKNPANYMLGTNRHGHGIDAAFFPVSAESMAKVDQTFVPLARQDLVAAYRQHMGKYVGLTKSVLTPTLPLLTPENEYLLPGQGPFTDSMEATRDVVTNGDRNCEVFAFCKTSGFVRGYLRSERAAVRTDCPNSPRFFNRTDGHGQVLGGELLLAMLKILPTGTPDGGCFTTYGDSGALIVTKLDNNDDHERLERVGAVGLVSGLLKGPNFAVGTPIGSILNHFDIDLVPSPPP